MATLSFEEFNSLIGQNSYVLCKGKERIDPRIVDYKTALAHIDRGGTVGYWVQPPYIVLDIDEGKQETKRVMSHLKMRTLCCATPKGIHMYFKTTTPYAQKIGMVTPFGLRCDFRVAKKGYVLLPYGTSGRKFNGQRQIVDLPKTFTPLMTSKTSLLNLTEGDGRNSALFAHLMQYKRAGATSDEIIDMAEVINKNVFAQPMDTRELLKICTSTAAYEVDDAEKNPYLIYGQKGPMGVNYRAIQDYFANRGDLLVMAQSVWRYTDGVYREANSAIRTEVQELIQDDRFISPSTIMNGYRMVVDDTRIQANAARLNKDKNTLNFRNGLYNIHTRQMTGHDPTNIQSIQIPHDLNLKDPLEFEETQFYEFIQQTEMPQDDVEMLLDFMAYCLTIDNNLKTFLMLSGPSNTGKSVLIRFITALIGEENTSALSIQELQQRFYPAQLYGKLMNACGDNSALPLNAIENLKKITGNDPIMYEAKGKDPFFFVPFSKLVFSFNQLPLQLEEKSNAFYKRTRILEMKKELYLDNPYVDALIDSAEELLPVLVARLPLKGIPESKRSNAAIETLRSDSDSIHAFIRKRCIKAREATCDPSTLYEKYVRFCTTNGREAHKFHNFNRHMESLGYVRRKKGTSRQWHGITFRGRGE